MKSIFNGMISFGLVNSPVKLYSAVECHDLKANQVHVYDGGAIRYHRICEECGEAVPFGDIAKGFNHDGETVVVTNEELEQEAASREITVKEFIPANALNPMMYEGSSYYVGPDGKNPKSYFLLVAMLTRSRRIALVEFTLRSRTRMGALTVMGDIIVLRTLRWADEIREPEFPVLNQKVNISKLELDIAMQLVEKMSVDYDPERYTDHQQEALRELVASKVGTPREEGVSDLLSKLQASVPSLKEKPPIRQWCKANGVQVNSRGRIPKDIVDRYEMATA